MVTADDINMAGFTRQLLGNFEAYAMLGLFEDAAYWLEIGLRPVTDEVERFIYRSYLTAFHGGWQELKSKLESFEQQTKTTYHDLPPGTTQNPGWSTIPPTKKNLGWLNILAGNYAFGIELFEPAVNVQSLEGTNAYNILRRLKELEKLHSLVFAYQQVGRDAAAQDLLLELQAVIEPLAASGEMMIAGTFTMLALNRSLLGDNDGALQAFEKAVELGWINYYWVINNPVWASTIALPGFQRLLSEVKIEVDRQRALVEAENNFRAEAERILAPMYAADE
jgi:tetratricopeptide (TPR) repeat protein